MVYVEENFVVSESDDTIASGFEPLLTEGIIPFLSAFGMITAIDFDHQLGIATKKIDDEVTHNVLSQEFVS